VYCQNSGAYGRFAKHKLLCCMKYESHLVESDYARTPSWFSTLIGTSRLRLTIFLVPGGLRSINTQAREQRICLMSSASYLNCVIQIVSITLACERAYLPVTRCAINLNSFTHAVRALTSYHLRCDQKPPSQKTSPALYSPSHQHKISPVDWWFSIVHLRTERKCVSKGAVLRSNHAKICLFRFCQNHV
jgi:hypothetical protein